jgi:hypothetical protein
MSVRRSRIMYIEDKSAGLNGPARIGRVFLSKSGRSYEYGGRRFLKCAGYKYNCIDEDSGERFWISGPRRDGADRLYVSNTAVEIDEDVREEYWRKIRGRLPPRA